MRFLILITVVFSFAHGTMVASSAQELAANCYPSSPMLYSDLCFGQIHRLDNSNSSQQYLPFSLESIALLLQNPAFGGQGNMNPYSLPLDAYSQIPLWQNSNPQHIQMGNYYGGMLK